MNKFQMPEIELVKFNVEDVITTSPSIPAGPPAPPSGGGTGMIGTSCI